MNSLKAYAAALAALLTAVVATGTDVLPAWAIIVLGAVATGITTWLTPPAPGATTPRSTNAHRLGD